MSNTFDIKQYHIKQQPFYQPQGDEIEIFTAAYKQRIPVLLKGPTGVAFSRQDPVAVAKALQAFVRANPALTIKVGLVEGKVLEPQALRSLADLPSKEALRSQLVGAIQGPMSQLVRLLTAPQQELVRVLEARSKGAAQ